MSHIFNSHGDLTVRDKFAIGALTALIERKQIATQAELKADVMGLPEDTAAAWDKPEHWKAVAVAAYALADAMMEHRAN